MKSDTETPVVTASRRVAQPQVVSQQRQPAPALARSLQADELTEATADDAPGSAPASAALVLTDHPWGTVDLEGWWGPRIR